MASSKHIMRHKLVDRVGHWLMAAGVLTLMGTSLAPILGFKFAWVTAHWIAGVILALAILFHIARSLPRRRFREMWIGLRDLKQATAKPGKYSLAQKLMHHGVSGLTLLATGTGLVMLAKIDTPLWQRDPYILSQTTWGIIYVVHGAATLFLVSFIMLHIYFALRPEKLFYTRSMIRGFVTREDYLDHHDTALWPVSPAGDDDE